MGRADQYAISSPSLHRKWGWWGPCAGVGWPGSRQGAKANDSSDVLPEKEAIDNISSRSKIASGERVRANGEMTPLSFVPQA